MLRHWSRFLLSAALLVTPVFGSAQTRSNTASLRVLVLDPSGAAIAGADVTVSIGNTRPETLKTNSTGEASFSGLRPGQYRIGTTAKGFMRHERDTVEIVPGGNRLEIKLDVAGVEEQLTVEQDKREANTDARGNAFSSVLTADQIAQLPDDPEEFENVIRQMAGPGAVMRVNGFRGGKLPPKSQIREIRFRMNPYSADNHDAGFVHVDITTKPGIELWNGSLTAAFRDESLNARNPAATYRGPEQTRRFGFELGGPVWKNHTSLFLSADGVNEYDTRTIIAQVPQGRIDGLVVRPNRRLNLAARAEHSLNKTHTLRGEYQRNATRRDNLGVGDFDLPERAYSTDAVENILRIGDSGVIGKAFVNEFRLQSTWQSNSIDSLSNAPTIIVQNAFTSGGAQIENARRLNEIELADNLDFSIGRNVMRTGVLFEYQQVRSNEFRNLTGTFTFGSLDQFNAGTPITYSRRIGDPRVSYNQYQAGWYFQDDLRIRKNLSVSLGLRHEFQSIVDHRSNFAPRLGAAWSPFKDGKTTIRAGLGVFYDWLPGEIYEQTLRVDGVKQRDLITQNPGFPIPSSGDDAIALPPSRIQIDGTLRQPTIYQLSLSAERQLPGNMIFRGGYVFQRGLHLLRGRNINAPVNDGTRPNPDLGNITQIESSANSFTHSLSLNLNWSRPGGYFFGGNYMLAKSTNEADSPLSLPVNNSDLRAERGPSLTDARHRFMLFSIFTLWKAVRLGVSYQYNSATPYNITTGFDDNADTVVNDRPSGTTRNSARGAGRSEMGLRLGYGFGWGKSREASSAGGPQVRMIRGDGGDILGSVGSIGAGGNKRYRMEFFAQAYNVLNHANLTGFSGVMSSPFFGQSVSALPGRRIETGIRFNF